MSEIPERQEALCVVYVTVGSEAEATQIASALVSEKLAACVNRVGPIQSTYVWEGEVQHDAEFLLMIKTRQQWLERLSQRVQELHSYDLPEVIALPIEGGLSGYLDWVREETRQTKETP